MTIIDRFAGEHAFLSNFHPSPLRHDDRWWPTVEHAYQAAKTASQLEKKRIQGAASPGQAKRLGQRVELVPHWDTLRFIIMHELLVAKFRQHLDLRAELHATRPAHLVEGNTWHDQVWGDCRCVRPWCAEPGENWLGRLLLVVRDHGLPT